MHVCIVGTGAAGWISCNILKNLSEVDKVTIIGSSSIPPIGVGESNTTLLLDFINPMIKNKEFTLDEFIVETDAAMKYGVMYKNWSKDTFLHYLKTTKEFSDTNSHHDLEEYGKTLANKNPNVHIHKLMGHQLFDEVNNNNILLEQDTYLHSYHFDAAKFITFFSKIALKNNKVNYIDDKVLGGILENDVVREIKTENNGGIAADFYIFATGDSKINEDFLKIKYKDMSDTLLTNKAIVYPLKYSNKREQFHPYTLAKTMKCGWRWITPTWSRIGTGYVFSTNHISIENAVDEFINDIGDKSITPHVVDFSPKHHEEQLHKNWCTTGMASGFLEPLDAPGLTLTINFIDNFVSPYISFIKFFGFEGFSENERNSINKTMSEKNFNFWASFILAQYKSCHRNDTDFWKDHKNVLYEPYENFINNLDNNNYSIDNMMLQQTLSAKNFFWKTNVKDLPYKTKNINYVAKNHLDFISNFHKIKDK